MSHSIHNPEGVGNCQVPCDVDPSFPVQSQGGALWNSAIGRRTFLKRTGGATLATALALHGTRMQVQAAETGAGPLPLLKVWQTTYILSSTGSWEDAAIYQGSAWAMTPGGNMPNTPPPPTSATTLITDETYSGSDPLDTSVNPNPSDNTDNGGAVSVAAPPASGNFNVITVTVTRTKQWSYGC
jgi:hypothetical protein